jgi:hypothetical protein
MVSVTRIRAIGVHPYGPIVWSPTQISGHHSPLFPRADQPVAHNQENDSEDESGRYAKENRQAKETRSFVTNSQEPQDQPDDQTVDDTEELNNHQPGLSGPLKPPSHEEAICDQANRYEETSDQSDTPRMMFSPLGRTHQVTRDQDSTFSEVADQPPANTDAASHQHERQCRTRNTPPSAMTGIHPPSHPLSEMSDVDGLDIVSKIETKHLAVEVGLGFEGSLDRGGLAETVLFAFEFEIGPRHAVGIERFDNHLRLVGRHDFIFKALKHDQRTFEIFNMVDR